MGRYGLRAWLAFWAEGDARPFAMESCVMPVASCCAIAVCVPVSLLPAVRPVCWGPARKIALLRIDLHSINIDWVDSGLAEYIMHNALYKKTSQGMFSH